MMILLNKDSIITGVCNIKWCVKWCTCIKFQNAVKLCGLTFFSCRCADYVTYFTSKRIPAFFIPIGKSGIGSTLRTHSYYQTDTVESLFIHNGRMSYSHVPKFGGKHSDISKIWHIVDIVKYIMLVNSVNQFTIYGTVHNRNQHIPFKSVFICVIKKSGKSSTQITVKYLLQDAP